MNNNNDFHFMQIAIRYAQRAIGTTAPNPAVGCVIVKNNQIIGTGHTSKGGRPHAETIALAMAGKDTKDATTYVTLEPCSHFGKTPPCTDALIKAGVSRVVIATDDPCKKVNGSGISALKNAGIQIKIGVCEAEARQLNAGFLSVQERGRPYVTLKMATSGDGKIAKSHGTQTWLTGEIARNYSHILRAKNDAIMVGTGTVLTDNPKLTCRLPGLDSQSPIRIVMDARCRIPAGSNLIQSARNNSTWVISKKPCDKLLKEGAIVFQCDTHNLCETLELLAKKGITRLLVEGGAKLASSFIQEGLIDELIWIQAPIIIGKDGIPALSCLDITQLHKSNSYDFITSQLLGDDIAQQFIKK